MVRAKATIVGITCALFFSGCGVYSFSGSVGSSIKTIAVPILENETVEYAIAEDLSTGVIDGFVTDNTLKVVGRSKADAILEGTVTKYERIAYTYDENDQVQEYKVNITVSVRLAKKDGGSIWEETALSAYGIYKAEEEEETGQDRAIEKIAEDIVNRTVRDW
jgi:outer membrane lipopolysaccharide assembly protein LptE/RlpB